ncbi:hypothetical protein AB0B97_00650 [Micromonospora sp. NPDC049004]|uniref:hypothetical protein n=1 Tax=Micromonospora sp. NPDC049004 TaxID=3154348 RepID=UPI0033D55062
MTNPYWNPDLARLIREAFASLDTQVMLRQAAAQLDTGNMVRQAFANVDTQAMLRQAAAQLDTGNMARQAFANVDTQAMLRQAAAQLDTGNMVRQALSSMRTIFWEDLVEVTIAADSTLTVADVEAELAHLTETLETTPSNTSEDAQDSNGGAVEGEVGRSSRRRPALKPEQQLAIRLVIAIYLGTALALHLANVGSTENRVFDLHQLITDQVQAVALALGALGPIVWLQELRKSQDDD